jgi:predicted AlkP superfamily pyrophosphatase or phosphodiesterase
MTTYPPVVLIVIDGLRPDVLGIDLTPHLLRFRDRGAYATNAQSVVPSLTLPCHVSIFYSLPPDRHGITSNVWKPLARSLPGIVEQAAASGKRCQFFYSWEPLRNLSKPGHLSLSYFRDHLMDPSGDMHMAEFAGSIIASEHPDFAFVYFGNVDIAGHHYGWMTDGYIGQVAKVDEAFDRLLRTLPKESTVLVLSDHGGHECTHGSTLPEDMSIVWMAAGPSIDQGRIIARPIDLLDTAPTVAHLLDFPPHAKWEGQRIGELFSM